MAGKDSKFEDGAGSITGFEDVGPNKTAARDVVVMDSPLKPKEVKPAEVPDIRYVMQCRDVKGNIVESRESDKPFHVVEEVFSNTETTDTQKPVLEIIITVRSIKKRSDVNGIPDYRSFISISDSVSCVSGDSADDDEHDNDDDDYIKKVGPAQMVIHSQPLTAALSAVIGSYPGIDFLRRPVAVSAPCWPLVHYRDALSRYRIAQPACHAPGYAAATARHVDVLLAYLERTYGERIREEEARHARSPPVATFEWLWLLFRPGGVVYRLVDDVWTAFVIESINTQPRGSGGVNDSAKATMYQIQCWNIEYIRGRMRRCCNSFTVAAFPGEQVIHTLEVVPAAFFKEDLAKQGGLTMAEKQIQMGKMYWELVKRPAYKEYDGELVDKHGSKTGHLTGRVIVDAAGYEQFAFQMPGARGGPRLAPSPVHPGMPLPPAPRGHPVDLAPPAPALAQFAPRCSCAACARAAAATTAPPPPGPSRDLYFLVCAPSVPAFLLADRRWGHVALDRLAEVRCDADAFRYLVLDPGVKLTVRALIGKFASADGKVSPWPNDFVRNKGEGRIFLLHGSPGVGKTCTAECVAELTRRPLLSITSGDLTPPSALERSLGYFLTLGERYGALVLLDEADVYLEQRRPRDLKRNALVSVFLRALEYYRGVLFLTTNRVETFDPAFTSRIHVALHYRRLTDADRERIWANNFDRLERDSAGKVFVCPSAREYVFERGSRGGGDGEDDEGDERGDVGELRWNGREIRNALQTAVALAETEAVDEGLERVGVSERHLRQVVKMSRGFKEFLRRRRGYDDVDDEDSEADRESEDERGELDRDDFP